MNDNPASVKLPTVPAAPPRCFMGCGRRVVKIGEICLVCWGDDY